MLRFGIQLNIMYLWLKGPEISENVEGLYTKICSNWLKNLMKRNENGGGAATKKEDKNRIWISCIHVRKEFKREIQILEKLF
eukprot:UN28362